MNNTQHVFGLSSFHSFDSRILFTTDRVSFLEWIREAAPEYELRITPNLVPISGWEPMKNDSCFKFKVFDNRLELQQQTDDNIVQMNLLCRSWAEKYSFIASSINQRRRHVGTAENFNFQTTIYQEKLKEATNILHGLTHDLRFLNLEASYKNISLEDIAHRVILENDMFMGYLARTEFLRVKWLNKLQQSRNICDHNTIHTEFVRELYEYHLLS